MSEEKKIKNLIKTNFLKGIKNVSVKLLSKKDFLNKFFLPFTYRFCLKNGEGNK